MTQSNVPAKVNQNHISILPPPAQPTHQAQTPLPLLPKIPFFKPISIQPPSIPPNLENPSLHFHPLYNQQHYRIPLFVPLQPQPENPIYPPKTFSTPSLLYSTMGTQEVESLEIRAKRSHLPIYRRKADIQKMVRENRVCIVTGATGCGKSTQVPQYILEDPRPFDRPCNIICTQPRRLAAMSLAHRVAKERQFPLGKLVGYHIGGNPGFSEETRLRFVTTGIALEMLKHDPTLSKFTHIIVDEIHERNVDDDVFLSHLRFILLQNSKVKVVVMSATLNIQKIKDYFKSFGQQHGFFTAPIPHVNIEQFCYTVAEKYIDDIVTWLKLGKRDIVDLASRPFDSPGMSDSRKRLLIIWLYVKHLCVSTSHSFLVFLPGISMIDEIETMLLSYEKYHRGKEYQYSEFNIIKLHSTITVDEQYAAMQTSPSTKRKVILATNIAETSITIPDVRYVFDSCLRRSIHYNPETNVHSLNDEWITKDCADQRKGRIGRVGPGVIYRLVPRFFYDHSIECERKAQIQSLPVLTTMLRVLSTQSEDPFSVLDHCLDPPLPHQVSAAIQELIGLEALSPKENEANSYELTFKGIILSRLPVSPYTGIFLLYSACFGELEDAIIIAAIIERKSPFISNDKKYLEIAFAMKHFYKTFAPFPCIAGGSDLISQLRAFRYWRDCKANGHFSKEEESEWCKSLMLSLFNLREIEDLTIQLREHLSGFQLCQPPTSDERNAIAEWRQVHQDVKAKVTISAPSEPFGKSISELVDVTRMSADFLKNAQREEVEETSYEVKEFAEFHQKKTSEKENKTTITVATLREDKSRKEWIDRGLPRPEDQYIDQAMEVLNNLSLTQSTPVQLSDFEMGQTGVIDTVRLYSFLRNATQQAALPVNTYPANDSRVFDNPFQLTFQSHFKKVALAKEPNCLILCCLLYGIFSQNNMVPKRMDIRHTFSDCPIEFNMKNSLQLFCREYVSRAELEGIIQPYGHVSKTFCQTPFEIHSGRGDIQWHQWFVEFYRPRQNVWIHSRDMETMEDVPDAVYLGLKDPILRGRPPPQFATQLVPRHHCAFINPEGGQSAGKDQVPSIILSRMSLFQPLLISDESQWEYHINASRVMSVAFGERWLAENVTCFMSKRREFGDALEAMLGSSLKQHIWTGEWTISIKGVDSVVDNVDSDIVSKVRQYLQERTRCLESLQPRPCNSVDGGCLSEIEEADSLWTIEEIWNKPHLTAQEAGKLLEKSILLLAEDGSW